MHDEIRVKETEPLELQADKRYNHTPSPEDEVDIWDLVRIIWDGRKYIIIFAAAFFAFGVFHISNGPTEYRSEAVLLQESTRETSSAQRFLQNFGGNFGFGQTSSEPGRISPSMYPTIIASVAFQYDLIFEELGFSRFSEPITLYEYFNEHYEPPFRDKVYSFIRAYTIQFPFRVFDYILNFSFFEDERVEREEEIVEIDERLLSLSSDERRPISAIENRISLTMDGNLITVRTNMPDPKAAAMLNVLVIERIQEYVTNYQIEKAQQNLSFIRQQKEQAKERYEEAQRALAEFRDQNINLSTNVARTEDQRLSNQQSLTFNIYNSIAVELEQAQLRLQEEIPVFSVLQKSSLPTSSAGGSNRILAVFLIMGAFTGLAWIFGVKIFEKIAKELNFN